jgi:two-component system, OmpR family, sensor histidine kinase VicK
MPNTSTEDAIVNTERTEVVYGVEKVLDRTIQDFATAKELVDACFDSDGPSVILSVEPVVKAAIDFIKRGGKIRMVTEITDKNISYCKELISACSHWGPSFVMMVQK